MRSWHCGILFAFLSCATGLQAVGERPVLDDGDGVRPWFSRLRNVAETPDQQLLRAEAYDREGRAGKALRAYRTLVSRWPAADEASGAQLRVAELHHVRGRSDAAFEAYEALLQRYPHAAPYGEVLERQYQIALDVMIRRRMRFIFGGYAAPETALPMFRWIVAQAPGAELAVRAQMRVAEIHEGNLDFEQAIDAYTRVLQLFPDSEEANQAAIRRAVCLYEYSRRRPNDARRADEAAFGLEHALQRTAEPEIVSDLAGRLDRVQERRAKRMFERARFYEGAERSPAAAALGYRELLRAFPDREPWSGMARARLSELVPAEPETGGGE